MVEFANSPSAAATTSTATRPMTTTPTATRPMTTTPTATTSSATRPTVTTPTATRPTIFLNGATLEKDKLYGIQRNTLEILRELDSMVEPGRVKLLVPEQGPLIPAFANIEVVVVPRPRLLNSRGAWMNLSLSRYLRKHNGVFVDTLLGLRLGGCDVVFVYDCIPEQFPETYPLTLAGRLKRELYLRRVARNLKTASVVLADSADAGRDINRFYGTSLDKIRVVPCAWQHFKRVEANEHVLDELGLRNREYFFSLGSRAPHKNLRWIAEAARQNPGKIFVVAGDLDIYQFEGQQAADNLDNVMFTGYIDDSAVKALMAHCTAFVQPSLCEGFGIPPMEAMSVGAHCILAKASSLPEIYGESAWYVDPLRYERIDLNEIMAQPIASNHEVLTRYSWQQSAQLFLEAIEEAAQAKDSRRA